PATRGGPLRPSAIEPLLRAGEVEPIGPPSSEPRLSLIRVLAAFEYAEALEVAPDTAAVLGGKCALARDELPREGLVTIDALDEPDLMLPRVAEVVLVNAGVALREEAAQRHGTRIRDLVPGVLVRHPRDRIPAVRTEEEQVRVLPRAGVLDRL